MPNHTLPGTVPAGTPPLHPAAADTVPDHVGPYRVLGELGRGGMGTVYRASDPALGREVAVKVLLPVLAADPTARDRFLREARAAAALDHDHVVPVYHVGTDGVPFLVMPLLRGESLDRRLRRDPPPDLGFTLRVGREVALGLAAAHARGLVHRDIKPGNVWLEDRPGGPRARLLDFGLARAAGEANGVTQPGAIIGTPAYMAPEQARGQGVDHRTDLFSLGVMLYRMLTGVAPFTGPDTMSVLFAVAHHVPPPPAAVNPAVPGPVSALVERLMAKNPADRPADAAGVAAELGTFLGTYPPTASADPVQPTRVPAAPRYRSRTRVLAVAAVAAVVAAVVGAVVMGRRPTPDPAPGAGPGPRGHVDLLVWRQEPGGPARRMRLTDAGALPLKAGDQFRVEAGADRPAYLYLFWVDTEGQVLPVYPWQPMKWDTRPGDERPITSLSLPPTADAGYRISPGPAGMEALVLLARAERLTAGDDAVREWFADLGPQRPVQDPHAAAWFEDGRVATRGGGRPRAASFDPARIDDPLLRVQGILGDRMRAVGGSTAAVGFATNAEGSP